jgi:hypothetical protein
MKRGMSKLCRLFIFALAVTSLGLAQQKATMAQAPTVFKDNFTVPLNFIAQVPCIDEELLFTGSLHVVVTVIVGANGDHVLVTQNDQGFSAVGMTTGTQYRRVGATVFQENLNSAEAVPLTFTFVNTFNIVGPGPDNNFLVHEVTHFTINANGILTASVEYEKIECQ